MLLTAGQVVGVAVQQVGDLTYIANLGGILGDLLQILQDRVLDKQASGVLGEHGKAVLEQLAAFIGLGIGAEYGYLAPIGLAAAADRLQESGFSCAVTAHNGVDAAGRNG